MGKLILALSFLSANFIYQYFLAEPNYLVTTERAYFQAWAMAFIVFWTRIIKKNKQG